MGTACAERFVLALCGPYLKYGAKNKAIGSKNDGGWNNNVLSCYNEQLYLIHISTCRGELYQREEVTEIVVNGVSITEGQSQHATSMNHGTRKSHQI